MSAALKRRFNFETVRPLTDRAFEVELISHQLAAALGDQAGAACGSTATCSSCWSPRSRTCGAGGRPTACRSKAPETVMSTAEAVNVAHAAALEARYLGTGAVTGAGIARQLAGVALKDSAEDAARLRYYVDTVVRERARTDARWREFLGAATDLWG